MVERDVTICNQRGLHARAASKFVRVAEMFDAAVSVSKDGTEVCGTSIMGLMMLAASPGTSIRLTATGPEAIDAVNALARLVADRFNEED